jgi:predicted nucleic acid-binding protein
MPFVMDASVTAAWVLPDEENVLAERVQDMLAEEEAIVPAVWWFEIRNLLITSERRNRLTPALTATVLANLAQYPIVQDNSPNEISVLRLAREHSLSVYDASYLELAARLEVPLATLDKELARAATTEAVRLISVVQN